MNSSAVLRFRDAWGRWLPCLPLPRGLIRLMSHFVQQAHYLDRLLDMTYRHVTPRGNDVPANDLARPHMRIEDYVRYMLATDDFPSK